MSDHDEKQESFRKERDELQEAADARTCVERMIGKMTSTQKAALLRLHRSRELSELLTPPPVHCRTAW